MKSLSLSAAGTAALLAALSACGQDVEPGDQTTSSSSSESIDTATEDDDDDETTVTDTTSSTTTSGTSTASNSTSGSSSDSGSSDSSGTTTSSTCAAGLIDCQGICIDPQTDETHCGASGSCVDPLAGELCDGGQECVAGVCSCPANFVQCENKCVNPLTDSRYCGASLDCLGGNVGKECGTEQVCDAGTCIDKCLPGEVRCDGICIDPAKDFNHCGASNDCVGANIGVQCKAGNVCVSGICQKDCIDGDVICDNECVNPWKDPAHCGAKDDCLGANSGMVCTAPDVCVEGVCDLNCREWQKECDGLCINPSIDPKYCGATDCANDQKGEACDPGEKCQNGLCVTEGCGDLNYEVQLPPSDVMLVLDKSGSMSIETWGDDDVTRWSSLHSIVKKLAHDNAPDVGEKKVHFGIQLYPSLDSLTPVNWNQCNDADGIHSFEYQTKTGGDGPMAARPDVVHYCRVKEPDLTIAATNDEMTIMGKLPPADSINVGSVADALTFWGAQCETAGATTDDLWRSSAEKRSKIVAGATPTSFAMKNAAAAIKASTAESRALMLITDGAETLSLTAQNGCGLPSNTRSEGFAKQLADLGIKTYVVGVDLNDTVIPMTDPAYDPDFPSDTPRTRVNRVAAAGGTMTARLADDPAELEAMMKDILVKISSCNVPLDPVPERYDLLEVKTKGIDAPWLYMYSSCAAAAAAGKDRGFIYTKVSGPYDEIELCGISCTEYKDSASVAISLNCPPPP